MSAKLVEEVSWVTSVIDALESGQTVEVVTKKYRDRNTIGFDAMIRIYDRNGRGPDAIAILRQGVANMRRAFEKLK